MLLVNWWSILKEALNCVKCLSQSLLQSLLLGFFSRRNFVACHWWSLGKFFVCNCCYKVFIIRHFVLKDFVCLPFNDLKSFNWWWKCVCFCYSGVWTTITMAMFHGILDVTIYQVENLINVERSIGNTLILFK